MPFRISNINKAQWKKKTLYTRKFCLACSPYGEHNTRNIITINSSSERICTCCNELKPLSMFYKNGTKTHSHCKTCLSNYYAQRQRNLKLQAVAYKGGKCELCGYDKHPAALEFHHLDPSLKDFAISSKATVNFNTLKPELDKCQLLCKNCHAIVHTLPTELTVHIY